jgi:nuclear transport factor 2 (NTF2) superfamily protein
VVKVQGAEDAWNTCDPEKVAMGYSENSVWRNRDSFIVGRAQIIELLEQKWQRELDYALRKQMWCFSGNRIAVRYQYESHDQWGQWWRSYGNELWQYDADGLNCRRESSINDIRINESERRIFGPRPTADHGKDVIALQ